MSQISSIKRSPSGLLGELIEVMSNAYLAQCPVHGKHPGHTVVALILFVLGYKILTVSLGNIHVLRFLLLFSVYQIAVII